MRDLESNITTPLEMNHFRVGPEAELQAMATPISHKNDSEKDSEHPDLYTDEDVMDSAPSGWPAVASRQMFLSNAAIHRRFSNLMQRILVNFEVELDCIDLKLFELDRADRHNGVLRTLPFDRHKFLAQCCGVEVPQKRHTPIQQPQHEATTYQRARPHTAPEQRNQHIQPAATPIQKPQHEATDQRTRPHTAPEQRGQQMQPTAIPIQQPQDTAPVSNACAGHSINHGEQRAHLIGNAKSILKEYHHFMRMETDFQSMRRVSRKQHLVHYLAVTKDQLPGQAAHQYLWARDDFVNTSRETVPQWFESLLYTTGPRFQRFLSIVLFCFVKREKIHRPPDTDDIPNGSQGDSGEFVYETRARRLGILQKILIALFSAVVLLIPVGLLHFYADSSRDRCRSKWVSFSIACASTAVFLVIITYLETNYGRALVGVCAFVAIMASFLANLSGNGAGC